MSSPVNNPEELFQSLGAILRTEMGLKEEQTILYNQPFEIPKDKKLRISIGVIGGRTFAVKTQYKNDTTKEDSLLQEQAVNRQEMVSIQIYSKSTEALQRNWEIPVAFNSITAQQAQEAGSFNIAKLPVAMNDISEGEGARRLYRYALTVMVQVAYRKTSNAQFFDNFRTPAIITNQ